MQTHILIIDDDLELTKLITRFLENHDYKVSSFDPLSTIIISTSLKVSITD